VLFHSVDYALFLAIALAGHVALRRARVGRIAWLFALSCLFYTSWHPAYIGLVFLSTSIDFVAAQRMGASTDPNVRKGWLAASLAVNLGLLGLFKYYDFFATAARDGLALAGIDVAPPLLGLVLPVGISFYTFEAMAYTIDVYYGRLRPERSALAYGSFIMFFPHLVAGPIIRAGDFLGQLAAPRALDPDRVSRALVLIGTGLVKKVCVADFLAVNLVDRVFERPDLYTAPEVVIGLYGFTMQLYCDFSGYTDVARGSALLFGIELPENFDRPYQSENPAEFWRRWHITLSTWLRDYLYYPLGGSRAGEVRTYVNLFLTVFLIGLWHGASWNFVLYGAIQGGAMVAHRIWRKRVVGDVPARPKRWAERALHVALCLQLVVFSRILFRASSWENAGEVTARLASGTTSMAQISAGVALVLVLSYVAHFLPTRLHAGLVDRLVRAPAVVLGAALAAALGACAWMATSDVVPYIYFQF
jgi:D-alanyl-lipoteichoic acid acyltransferase DltB (MBOAT superfamily)